MKWAREARPNERNRREERCGDTAGIHVSAPLTDSGNFLPRVDWLMLIILFWQGLASYSGPLHKKCNIECATSDS